SLSSIGLTLPSLALLGLAIPLFGIGTIPSVVLVVFYAVLPILRNAIVGLQDIDAAIIASARGQGMSPAAVLFRVRLRLAWPVSVTGVRVCTQVSMGVAAVAAYAVGAGVGSDIVSGLRQIGGANALNDAFVGPGGIVIIAVVVDALLALL